MLREHCHQAMPSSNAARQGVLPAAPGCCCCRCPFPMRRRALGCKRDKRLVGSGLAGLRRCMGRTCDGFAGKLVALSKGYGRLLPSCCAA
eukprot:1147460-Pelagomonas_calceolata.AAC.4